MSLVMVVILLNISSPDLLVYQVYVILCCQINMETFHYGL